MGIYFLYFKKEGSTPVQVYGDLDGIYDISFFRLQNIALDNMHGLVHSNGIIRYDHNTLTTSFFEAGAGTTPEQAITVTGDPHLTSPDFSLPPILCSSFLDSFSYLASELRALWRDISRDDEAAAPAALHVDGKPTSTDVEPAAVVHSSLRKRHVHQSS
mmetsp:Transcript_30181/g.66935  ORF Transcript_30181/g.66935 Transcript_30181/m.66935 type:complete len:159 (-) Transcript_30181:647-1123(-)|eukprot:CAMPEP_0202900808 /NCGR_PEP_ID=MMETSP1392-20130828/12046_1 /ASSEMBLY_ACC=CAM_ASM_000868 /TAXON_ID=225041 /ORGANISM="Chlamydomonas chlamydogama, Strain SAG 11-48b" /LENGTH=158 /DNA_ID=CAMNT_0049587253 /DNA_START=69 /DNA_END=545 /DNA_ORIENTATION=+